jgi:hypothetical protein
MKFLRARCIVEWVNTTAGLDVMDYAENQTPIPG